MCFYPVAVVLQQNTARKTTETLNDTLHTMNTMQIQLQVQLQLQLYNHIIQNPVL
jgi:hypothetical protein